MLKPWLETELTKRRNRSWDHNNITYFSLSSTRILGGFGSGLSVLCDIFIVFALIYYLHSKRTGFKRYVLLALELLRGAQRAYPTSVVVAHRTDSMIDHLIVYAINRGILTA